VGEGEVALGLELAAHLLLDETPPHLHLNNAFPPRRLPLGRRRRRQRPWLAEGMGSVVRDSGALTTEVAVAGVRERYRRGIGGGGRGGPAVAGAEAELHESPRRRQWPGGLACWESGRLERRICERRRGAARICQSECRFRLTPACVATPLTIPVGESFFSTPSKPDTPEIFSLLPTILTRPFSKENLV
jgi:hypothetical protein